MKKICAFCICAAVLFLCSCSLAVSDIYPNGDKYSCGDAVIEQIPREMKISWESGKVSVQYHDKNTVEVYEVSTAELSDRKKVHWLYEDGVLDIRFAASGESVINIKKELTVLVPYGTVFDKLSVFSSSADTDCEISAVSAELSSASGNIAANIPKADKCKFSTASGNVCATLANPKSVSADSSSGKIDVSLDSAEELKFDTASGKINVSLTSAEELKIESASGNVKVEVSKNLLAASLESASGDIELYIPKDMPFSAEIDTASGKFDCDIPTVRKGKRYISGNGSAKLEFDTASGDITMRGLDFQVT